MLDVGISYFIPANASFVSMRVSVSFGFDLFGRLYP